MGQRYQVREGIVIRRTTMPNGDVVATLFGDGGKWRGIARKGKLVGGNVGRLSLFHDVTVQFYRRREDDLAVLTQVQLNGALPRLSNPSVYPFAHVLAELTDKLTVDVHLGESMYSYLASGLRGLNQHPEPEAVAIVYAWKLIQQAGLAPRLNRCVNCGKADLGQRFDVAAGGQTCSNCNTGINLAPVVIHDLTRIINKTVREALEPLPSEYALHWALLSRYISYHIGDMQSLLNLYQYRSKEDAGVAT